MFKVGDIVRRVSQPEGYSGALQIGDTAIVQDTTSAVDYMKLAGQVGYFKYHHFELAKEPAVAPASSGRALPTDSESRKLFPLFSGCLAYFPAALAEVSNHSYLGNEKHNPGKPLQHARNKSGDHLDCTLRHIVDSREVEGRARVEELRAAAWRILAELQEELERQGTKTAPAATFD